MKVFANLSTSSEPVICATHFTQNNLQWKNIVLFVQVMFSSVGKVPKLGPSVCCFAVHLKTLTEKVETVYAFIERSSPSLRVIRNKYLGNRNMDL